MILDVICPVYQLHMVYSDYKGVEVRHTLREEDLLRFYPALDIILAHAHEAARKSIDYIELKDNGYIVTIYKRACCGVYRISNFDGPLEDIPCDL